MLVAHLLVLAADIGDGPLGRLPGPRLQMLMQKAEAAKLDAQAKEAEALAKASIFQATSEKERWKDMEVR